MSNGGRDAARGALFDYTTVGHVTADVLADGSRQPGGGAFYSALQAARLGLSAKIVTRGVASEIESLLEPYASELSVEIAPSAHTTTLTAEPGAARRQRVLSWAGPMGDGRSVDTRILHLAPVARETSARWRGRADFVGLTPQGLVRAWEGDGALITHVPLSPGQVPERCDAIVISEAERESCAALLDGRAPITAITAAERATTLRLPDGRLVTVPVPPHGTVADDLGAGDVFAAAFFVSLWEGLPAAEAAAFANAAAAVKIEGLGASKVAPRGVVTERMRAAAPASRPGP